MFNLHTICTNLAAKYAPGTITTPTSAPAMRFAYAQTPASIPATPAVYIEVDDGEVVMGAGTWDVTHHLVVNFLLSKAPGDPERVEANRQRWLATLLAATHADADLTLPGVVKSAFSARYEFVQIDFGADLYDGIRVFVDVIVREPVTLSA
jgi:hypothetical protein